MVCKICPLTRIFHYNSLHTALCYMAQVHTIFQPQTPLRSKIPAPPHLDKPLIYIQLFCVLATPEQHPELGMLTIERSMLWETGHQVQKGLVILISWVLHALELVPVFGTGWVPPNVTSATIQELYDVFYLNYFADKEIHILYNMLNGAVRNGHVDVEFNYSWWCS